MKKLFVGLATILIVAMWGNYSAAEETDQLYSRIAFGSCMVEHREQPIWESVIAAQPDCFILTGDNIYGDTLDMGVLKKKYSTLGAVPGYALLKKTCPIYATWDDHDYGQNDAGAEYPYKAESQNIFLNFFDEPKDSLRRKTPGVYDAKIVGPKGKRVQIILLDTRYFRSPLVRVENILPKAEGHFGPYDVNPDKTSTVLGEDQWTWLEEQLKLPAEIRFIVTSIQAIPNEHHWEKWGNFPHERRRLFQLIRATKTGGVILISGDRHHSEISRLPRKRIGYPLIEVTSSALNNSGNKWFNEVNPFRVGVPYVQDNFGMVTIDWTQSDPEIKLQILNVEGKAVIQYRTQLSTIQH